jgi:hypothetical protein
MTVLAFLIFCHSGDGPTGPREARPDDRLRPEPGIQKQPPRVHLDSGSGAISAFTRVFEALWRRPGMTIAGGEA